MCLCVCVCVCVLCVCVCACGWVRVCVCEHLIILYKKVTYLFICIGQFPNTFSKRCEVWQDTCDYIMACFGHIVLILCKCTVQPYKCILHIVLTLYSVMVFVARTHKSVCNCHTNIKVVHTNFVVYVVLCHCIYCSIQMVTQHSGMVYIHDTHVCEQVEPHSML